MNNKRNLKKKFIAGKFNNKKLLTDRLNDPHDDTCVYIRRKVDKILKVSVRNCGELYFHIKVFFLYDQFEYFFFYSFGGFNVLFTRFPNDV